MIEIKYINCLKNNNNNNNYYTFIFLNNNNKIIIYNNTKNHYNCKLDTKNKLYINDAITNTFENTYFIKLKPLDKININVKNTNNLSKLKIKITKNKSQKILYDDCCTTNLKLKNKITIVNPKCMTYISNVLKNKFIDNGWDCVVVDICDYDIIIHQVIQEPNHYILLYCVFLIDTSKLIPGKYIIYQLEQNINNQLSQHYSILYKENKLFDIFNNAKLLIDYNKQNQFFFKNFINITPKLMNIPFKYDYYTNNELNNKLNDYTNNYYDILFIGCINERRQNIIDKLKKKYYIYIPPKPVYDYELYNLFKSYS